MPVWSYGPLPPKWPGVIGVISTVIGGLSLLSFGFSLISMLAFRNVTFPMPGGARGPNPAMQQFTGPLWWVDVLQWGAWVVCGVLLLLAGVRTMRRRASGRTLHLWCAWLFLAYIVATIVLQLLGVNPALQRMRASGGAGLALAGSNMVMVGVIVNSVVLGAYPVFLVLWFGPRRRSPEIGAAGGPGAGWAAVGGQWLP